jgi:hypothetical protein
MNMGPLGCGKSLQLGKDDSSLLRLSPNVPKRKRHQPARSQIASMRVRRRGSFGALGWLLILVASLWILPTSAVFLDFQNCLSNDYKQNTPTQLQFVPKFLNARFNSTNPDHSLNVTVWGSVAGSGPEHLVLLPPANDTDYWRSNQTNLGGKILDIPEPDSAQPKITTLFNKVNVLTYEPFQESTAFCGRILNGTCPLAPAFDANEYVPLEYCNSLKLLMHRV